MTSLVCIIGWLDPTAFSYWRRTLGNSKATAGASSSCQHWNQSRAYFVGRIIIVAINLTRWYIICNSLVHVDIHHCACIERFLCISHTPCAIIIQNMHTLSEWSNSAKGSPVWGTPRCIRHTVTVHTAKVKGYQSRADREWVKAGRGNKGMDDRQGWNSISQLHSYLFRSQERVIQIQWSRFSSNKGQMRRDNHCQRY